MKLKIECINCFLKQAMIASRLSTKDYEIQLRALRRATKMISELDDSLTPPEIATGIFKAVIEETGNSDAYKELKLNSNNLVKELLPEVANKIMNSENPLEIAIKASLCGNIIDYGILEDFDIKALIGKELNIDIDKGKIDKFSNMISTSNKIIFLADNAGEIGFDGLLLDEIKKINNKADITIIFCSAPIINDATRADLEFFGLEKKFNLIERPNSVGTDLKILSDEVKRLLNESNLIISKGQANYEILEKENINNIVFLLRAKCSVVAENTGVNEGEPVLIL